MRRQSKEPLLLPDVTSYSWPASARLSTASPLAATFTSHFILSSLSKAVGGADLEQNVEDTIKIHKFGWFSLALTYFASK